LSEFADADDEPKEALIMSPYDIHQVAAPIRDALKVPPEMRARRLQLRTNNLDHGSASCWFA
jgi:trehalose-6-phosphate synthase